MRIEGLVVRYGRTIAVNNLSLTIEQGEVFGLLGPNGAGKTSTMHAIAGIVRPAAGHIHLDSEDGRIGIAPQENALYPPMTAAQNLNFFGALNGLSGRVLSSRVQEALELVELGEHRGVPVKHFSGGMTRRLNFAAAILHRPSTLLLDEPTLGVDPQARALLLEYIRSYCSEGATVIYSTHYMEEVERICDRVGIIDHGNLIALGPVEELIRTHAKPMLEIRVDGELKEEDLSSLQGYRADDSDKIRVEVESVGQGLAEVAAWTSKIGLSLLEVEVVAGSLESVFLDLTGRRLRAEPEPPMARERPWWA